MNLPALTVTAITLALGTAAPTGAARGQEQRLYAGVTGLAGYRHPVVDNTLYVAWRSAWRSTTKR